MEVPQKIVLKSTTKLSLNERFTQISRSRPDPAVMAIRAKLVNSQNASAKNRRLALQMANRPSVKAALGQQTQRTKQRLGVQARLGLPPRGRGGRARASTLAGRLGSPRGGITPFNRQRGGQRGRGMVTRGFNRGFGNRGRGAGRGMGRGIGRGAPNRTFRGRGANASYNASLRPVGRGRGQGQRGRGQRGRGGRGRGQRGAGRQTPSKEDLDIQLDAYMAGSDQSDVMYTDYSA